jgi:hypothetical protein
MWGYDVGNHLPDYMAYKPEGHVGFEVLLE